MLRCLLALLALLAALPAPAADLVLAERGAPRASIAAAKGSGPSARTAARLLRSRIEARTGVRLPLAEESAGRGARIVFSPPQAGDDPGEEGFVLRRDGNRLWVRAREGRGFLYAAGKILRTARYSPGAMTAAPPEGPDRPAMSTRVLYLAIHCDNFYEMEPAEAVVPIVEEAALWGVNGLSVWLDESQYNDPFDASADNAAVKRKWEKQKRILRAAQQLGLRPGYVLSANDLYRNQARPEILAQGTDSWNRAPLACPSTRAGREAILRNKTNLFRDLAAYGVRLENALLFPYDTGGCLDARCRPWILTFLKLTEDVAGVIRKFHPGARVFVTDWHSKDDEAGLMAEFFRARPAWLNGIWKDDRHAPGRFAGLPSQYETLTFMDITETGAWGTVGANPMPGRFSKFMGDFQAAGHRGYMAYSEGIYDDFNKALTAQLAWNPARPAREIAGEYANYFFAGSAARPFQEMVEAMEASWSNPLAAWSAVKFIQTPPWASATEALAETIAGQLGAPVRASWRWQVFERRARLGTLVAALRTDTGMAPEKRRALIEEYRRGVTDLRESVYKEPVTRFPSMLVDQPFMTGLLGVDARR